MGSQRVHGEDIATSLSCQAPTLSILTLYYIFSCRFFLDVPYHKERKLLFHFHILRFFFFWKASRPGDKQKAPNHWFSTHMSTTAGLGQAEARKQELSLGLPHGWVAGIWPSEHQLLPASVYQQEPAARNTSGVNPDILMWEAKDTEMPDTCPCCELPVFLHLFRCLFFPSLFCGKQFWF